MQAPSYPDRGIWTCLSGTDLCAMAVTDTAPAALRLDQLPERRWAIIADVTVPHQGPDRALVRRLVELGFVPGQRVRIVAEGIGSREPLAVRVGQTTFALRQREAAFIMVTPA